MDLRISRTPPFRDYQRRIGNATYHINTTVVGLELVARGGQKPVTLSIAWRAPNNPRQCVDQAKALILVSLVNLAVDSFDAYLRALAKVPWIPIPDHLKQIMFNAVMNLNNHAYSLAERAEQVMRHLNLEGDELLFMLDLMAHWRNCLIHSTNAKNRLSKQSEEQLRCSREYFLHNYAAFDIVAALDHFKAFDNPTLKEATTLIAAGQNLVRLIDKEIVVNAARTAENVEIIARSILRQYLIPADGNVELNTLWGQGCKDKISKGDPNLGEGWADSLKERYFRCA